jgi:hypothetical protein
MPDAAMNRKLQKNKLLLLGLTWENLDAVEDSHSSTSLFVFFTKR